MKRRRTEEGENNEENINTKLDLDIEFIEKCMKCNQILLDKLKSKLIDEDADSDNNVNPLNIRECLERKKLISKITHNTYLMDRRIKDMSNTEYNYLQSNCDHKWVVDYEGCWGPCDRTPMKCEKCGI